MVWVPLENLKGKIQQLCEERSKAGKFLPPQNWPALLASPRSKGAGWYPGPLLTVCERGLVWATLGSVLEGHLEGQTEPVERSWRECWQLRGWGKSKEPAGMQVLWHSSGELWTREPQLWGCLQTCPHKCTWNKNLPSLKRESCQITQ